MKEFRELISKTLREKRPKITDGSLKTYTSNLFNLNKKMNGEKSLEFFRSHDEIIKYIQNHMTSNQTQKTVLSALFILTEIKEYREVMIDICKKVNDSYKTQKMSAKQKEHRISFDEVKEKVDALSNALKTNPTKQNYELYLIACFSSGVFSPPRRSEFSNVKIKNFDGQHDNYLSKKKIIFNRFKTAKKYGTQEYNIPTTVLPILRKYLKMNTSDYLFPKKNGDAPMTNVDYNRMLQKIFGKGISVDALRSIFLSEKYKNMPSMEDMQNTATEMGHTVLTSIQDYVKR